MSKCFGNSCLSLSLQTLSLTHFAQPPISKQACWRNFIYWLTAAICQLLAHGRAQDSGWLCSHSQIEQKICVGEFGLVAKSCQTLCHPMDCIAHQTPLSMGFSRYWSGFPFPFPLYRVTTPYCPGKQGSSLRVRSGPHNRCWPVTSASVHVKW